MKKFKFNLLILISILTVCLMGTTFKAGNFTFAGLEGNALNISNSNINKTRSNSNNELIDANSNPVLIYSPILSASNETELFVYDEYDNMLKIYNKQTKKLREVNATKICENVINISVQNNLLFILTTTPSIEVFNATTLEKIDEVAPTINGANNITTYQTSESNICVVLSKFNNETHENSLEIFNIENNGTNEEASWAFNKGSSTITAERNLTLTTKISNMTIAPTNNSSDFYLVFSSEKSVYYLTFQPNSQTQRQYDIKKVDLDPDEDVSDLQEEITGLARILHEGNNYLCVATESGINAYYENSQDNYNIETNIETNPVKYSKNLQNIKSISSFENVIYLSNPSNQIVSALTLVGQKEEHNLEFQDSEIIKNDELNNTALAVQSFKYFKTKAETAMFATPFSSNAVLSNIPANTHVCQIASTQIGESNISNFVYCLITINSKNYYGFIKADNLETLPASTFANSSIKVYSNTNLYKLPTRIIDGNNPSLAQNLEKFYNTNKNSTLKTFTDVTTLSVLESDVNNNYVAGFDKFILVQASDGTMGFVELTRTLASSGTKEMVTNNGTIKRETSVYLEADSSSDIIDTLEKGQRVKIADNQKTNSKFLKITYNNQNGDEITGYILSDDVSRDSWTVLQIIGLVFVGLNVIFLIILLCVKKKINHD